jgi:hypothetical protein
LQCRSNIELNWPARGKPHKNGGVRAAPMNFRQTRLTLANRQSTSAFGFVIAPFLIAQNFR